MHSFLRSIGFSKFQKKKQIDALIMDVVQHPDHKHVVEDGNGVVYGEYNKAYGESIGIAVRGEYTSDNTFEPVYYYPYFLGTGISTYEKIDVEKHAEKDSFAGICDDVRVGVTLIFYLQNAMEYRKKVKNSIREYNMATTLSALSNHGMILLPLEQEESKIGTKETISKERSRLIAAAREGDQEAIESLTLEDIDTYSMISRRIAKEDVLSIVKSYFMPFGIESDQYSILGEILDVHPIRNDITEEILYQMSIHCNGMHFDVCINKQDLLGEPAVGRRFKGNIWMQGLVHYDD